MASSQQKIGLLGLTALVLGNLIGSAVFLLPATLAFYGSISLLGWVAASFSAIIFALLFSSLSQMLPKTGGPYVYANEAFGKNVGFYVCWGYWVMSWVSNVSLVVGATGYLSQIFGYYSKEMALLIEISILTLITAINLYSIKMTSTVETALTIAKVIPLILLPLAGLTFINMDNFAVFNATSESNSSVLNIVAFMTFWGFVGLETGTVPAGNVKKPRKNIPLATIFGTSIAAVIYMLGTFVIMGVLSRETLIASKAPYADAAAAIFGGSWAIPVAIAAVVSCIGALNGWILIVGKMPQAAAEDNLFPKIFAKTNNGGSPYYGILVSSALTILLIFMSASDALIDQFQFIMEVSVTLILLIYAVTVAAFFKLLHKKNALISKQGILATIALTCSIWTLWGASVKMLILSLIFIVCGIPMHLWMKYTGKHSIRSYK